MHIRLLKQLLLCTLITVAHTFAGAVVSFKRSEGTVVLALVQDPSECGTHRQPITCWGGGGGGCRRGDFRISDWCEFFRPPENYPPESHRTRQAGHYRMNVD